MGKKLRVLHIEDQERDVALLTRYLKRAGYDLSSHRVDTDESLRLALENSEWDVILCDYSMPTLNAIGALKIVKEMQQHIPFIIVSGTVGEAVAVDAMRAGADDYLMKDNLVRLVPIIERELLGNENRRARRQAEVQTEHLHIQLEGQRQRLDNIVANVPGVVWETWDEPNPALQRVNFVSDYINEMLGYSIEDWLSNPNFWLTIMHEDDRERVIAGNKLFPQGGKGLWREFRLLAKDGREVWVESHSVVITDESGKPIGRRGVSIDITERKHAEEGLRAAEEKYRSIFENAIEGISQSTPEGEFIAVNPALARILGYDSPEDLIQHRRALNINNFVNPAAREEFMAILKRDDMVVGFECEIYRKDRSQITTLQNLRSIRDTNGRLLHYEGTVEEVTERRLLETQLRQSQKLEAIGMLAGGIAHDFNNLLTVIGGYCDLSLSKLREQDPLRRNLMEISKAADRAAVLTRQLLAFSRKQVLQPKVLDLNSVVSEMEKLLRRLIGEDVEFRAVLGHDLGSIKADPGQIEQVIMNLAVNSRDAMPNGGRLMIETANIFLDEEHARQHVTVTPGHYVMLAITDSGCGMDAVTKTRVFEPFFTTKDPGKGTGLGLSTVYGIVKQSGGTIWIYSELGKGTTIKVYLPRVDEVPQYAPPSEVKTSIRGTETILLAEDEEMVRQLAREVLSTYGYQVLVTSNGGGALLICESHPEKIDLLLTDVVMPEMGGPQLAARLQQLRPNLKVLYMSGYTDNAIVHQGVLDENQNFIQKPFSPISLAERVRSVLDSRG
jgi:PAS domain S-box-containing protein